LVKLEASLSEDMRMRLRHATVGTHSFKFRSAPTSNVDMAPLREAIWDEQAVYVFYKDLKEQDTQRKIWPLSIYFFDKAEVIIAWCCMREDFRMFRLDRIQSIKFLQESFRPKRVGLLREFFLRVDKKE